MKHRNWFVLFLLVLSFGLISCVDTSVNLDEIDIEAVDQINVPAGTYRVPYTIEDLSSLVKNHGATVSIVVVDSSELTIPVTGDTFTVAENEVYTVTIVLTVDGETKEKTITITAIVRETAPVTVSFDVVGGTPSIGNLVIASGSVPELPVVTKDGFVFDGWYLDSSYATPYNGEALTQDTTLYAKWMETSIPTVSVGFDLQGGVGNAPTQTVPIGSLAVRPQTDPTKDGYLFLGWYASVFDSVAFVFESTQIYQNTTLYAKWEEVVSNQHKITYDLNGAIQPEEWNELVVHGEKAVGPTMDPVRQGHLFQGWAYDPAGLVMFDFQSAIIQADLTLYAVWHVDFEVHVLETQFEDPAARDAFDLVDGVVFQQYELFANLMLYAVENNLELSEERLEYGALLSRNNGQLTYYAAQASRLVGDLSQTELNQASLLTFRLITEDLISEASYFYRFYVRYETTILYSPIYELQSLIKVDTATAVGLEYVLSGGVYKLDNGTSQWRPSMMVAVKEGYEALIDSGAVETGYFNLYREGLRSIVTTDLQTGHRYLHVFRLDFQTPHVQIAHSSTVSVSNNVTVNFGIIFPHLENINYPNPELGVLYSKTTSFLKLGLPGVSVKAASMNDDEVSFSNRSDIATGGDAIYVRGYATMNGKTSYSDYVYLLEKNGEGVYAVAKSIRMYEEKFSPDQSYSWSFGPTAVVRVYRLVGEEWQFTSYQNSVEILGVGQYFVQMVGVNSITDVLIVDETIAPSGVENGQTYVGSVLVTLDQYNQDMYMSYNGGDYVYLPASVRLMKAGSYELFYRTATGYVSIQFTITNPTA